MNDVDIVDNNYNVVFIIAHKYVRGYESYLKYYISNIFKFYKNALVLVVDNNSNYKDDVFSTIDKNENIIFLDNNIECKFELGGYQVGIKYLIDNNLLEKYHYVICTQDTFILKNKVDFNTLLQQNIIACTINTYIQDGAHPEICELILTKLNLYNNLDKISFCWCNSFIVHTEKIHQLYSYLKHIVITNKSYSESCERFLARILWELNEYTNYDIDGDLRSNRSKYNEWCVDVYSHVPSFFVKKIQQKNETTTDS